MSTIAPLAKNVIGQKRTSTYSLFKLVGIKKADLAVLLFAALLVAKVESSKRHKKGGEILDSTLLSISIYTLLFYNVDKCHTLYTRLSNFEGCLQENVKTEVFKIYT